MTDILKRIETSKRAEIAAAKAAMSLEAVRAIAESADPPRGFAAALRRTIASARPALIAEIKKASPSRGILSPDFQPVMLARAYEQGGAAALSILTDRQFFQGSLEDLHCARSATRLPALRKDFTIDEYHVLEAAAGGADAGMFAN